MRPINNDDLIESIDWVSNGLAKILSLMESILDRPTTGDEFPMLQDHQVTAFERPAWTHRQKQPDLDLVIMATLGGHTTPHQPLLAIGLCLADYKAQMENLLKPYPFGLESTGSAY
jgi:hypothetical protein